MAKKSNGQSPDYEGLGRMLVSIGELGYADKKKFYRMNFIRGMFAGLGGVIGATIVVALLLFILSLLGEVPFIGDIADSVRDTIDER